MEGKKKMMDKMIGCSAGQNADIKLMKEAKIGWVRVGVAFPFLDEEMTKLSPRYLGSLETIKYWKDSGFKVAGISPLYGMMFTKKALEEVIRRQGENSPFKSKLKDLKNNDSSLEFVRFVPEWVGNCSEPKFYEVIEKVSEYIAKELKDSIEYYQISNEMDITRFRGEMTQVQAADFMYASAKGIKKGNPSAKVGINTSCMTNPESTYFYETLYSDKCDVHFDYAGVDYYFGSHHPGTPFDWQQTIEDIYRITKRPIMIAEWGYSSIGEYLTDGWPEEPNKAPNENGEFWVCARHAWAYAWKGVHNKEVQAEYFTEALKIFAQNDHVIGCFQYDWQDDPMCFCGRPNCPHECGWGIVDSEGKPKPSYYAFKAAVEQYFK